MIAKSTVTKKEQFFLRAKAAMKKAAIEARETAIETGTGIVIVKKGKVVKVSAEELKKQKAGGRQFRIRVKTGTPALKKSARQPLAS
jgi:hypothetical protein